MTVDLAKEWEGNTKEKEPMYERGDSVPTRLIRGDGRCRREIDSSL